MRRVLVAAAEVRGEGLFVRLSERKISDWLVRSGPLEVRFFDAHRRWSIRAACPAAPGTIRADFAHMSKAYANANGLPVANLVHASGNAEEAAQEIGVWFSKAEIFDYQSAAQRFAS